MQLNATKGFVNDQTLHKLSGTLNFSVVILVGHIKVNTLSLQSERYLLATIVFSYSKWLMMGS